MALFDRIKSALSAPEKTPSTPSKPLVLVVDDDEAVRWMLVRALEATYNVVEASDGRPPWISSPRYDCRTLSFAT